MMHPKQQLLIMLSKLEDDIRQARQQMQNELDRIKKLTDQIELIIKTLQEEN